MKSALLVAMLCALPAVATAQPSDQLPGELQQPTGALLVSAPELRAYDEAAARRRLPELDRAITAAREPKARAALLLGRARLRAAQGLHERRNLIAAQLRRAESRYEAALPALDKEI